MHGICHIVPSIWLLNAESQLEQANSDASHSAAASSLQHSQDTVPEICRCRPRCQNAPVVLMSCFAGTPAGIGLTTSGWSKHHHSCV